MTRGRPIQCRRGWTRIRYFALVADADWQRILGQNLWTDADSKISGSAHLWLRCNSRLQHGSTQQLSRIGVTSMRLSWHVESRCRRELHRDATQISESEKSYSRHWLTFQLWRHHSVYTVSATQLDNSELIQFSESFWL